ncbi:hypothetical protein DS2_17802 [Catenovulum agarivorans DS-2]|uniref:Uncharacterized protein n=1 Tax=Catenovulum agarivorans DS-2 TaxID=1328313 RepID=W7QSK8_9ALTE|nr:hypothetical protein DS2_17802 [Catenovulum agarivorans DS-2]
MHQNNTKRNITKHKHKARAPKTNQNGANKRIKTNYCAKLKQPPWLKICFNYVNFHSTQVHLAVNFVASLIKRKIITHQKSAKFKFN